MDLKFKRQLFIFALLTNKITEPIMLGRHIIYSFFCKRIRNTRLLEQLLLQSHTETGNEKNNLPLHILVSEQGTFIQNLRTIGQSDSA